MTDFNFEDMLTEASLTTQALNTHLYDPFEYFLHDDKEDVSNQLSNMIENIVPTGINLNKSYILGIYGDDLKFAQSSNKYIFDELMNINMFLQNINNKFIKNLKRLYFIDDKTKMKYIEKAARKNIETLYNNDSIGSDILLFIEGKKKILADKYGVQDCILDNIDRPDNLEKQIIIVLSFDVDLFEVYYSIPFKLHEEGTVNLEHELIYCSNFNDIDVNHILELIKEYSEV